MPELKFPRIKQIEYRIEENLVEPLFADQKNSELPIVNNTAADIDIERLNPLSDLRTEVEGVQNFSKEIPIYRIKSFFEIDENCHTGNLI